MFLLVAAIATTTMFLPLLLPEHYLIGLLLVPPLLAVAPILVASTMAVFASGIELWLFGLRFGSLWPCWPSFAPLRDAFPGWRRWPISARGWMRPTGSNSHLDADPLTHGDSADREDPRSGVGLPIPGDHGCESRRLSGCLDPLQLVHFFRGCRRK